MMLAILASMCFNVAPLPALNGTGSANQLPIYTMDNQLRTSDRIFAPINLEEGDVQRFWSKVDIKGENECWLWIAARFKEGYGAFKLNGQNKKASRVAFVISNGSIPNGMLVCHSCNNPPCCNPKHLFAGSYDDNMKHMIACGRSLAGDLNPMRIGGDFVIRGEKHPSSKMTQEKVLDIRKRHADKTASLGFLAREYGVTKQSIYAIVHRKSWTHI